MTTFLKVKNRAVSKLASDVSVEATEWTVATGEGDKFPSTYPFHITCEDEIVRCTSRTGDALTVIRAQEETDASPHSAGKDVELRITALIIQELQAYLQAIKFDIFDNYRDFGQIVVEDTNAWTKTIDGSGSIKDQGTRYEFNTGNTNGNKAYLVSVQTYDGLIDLPGLVTAQWVILTASLTNCTALLVLLGDDGVLPDETYEHFGFKIINGDIYATNAEYDTQKITDTGVNVAAGYQFLRLKVVVNPGVDCKFYVNDVLKVTHTEHLPTETGFYHIMGITTAENVVKAMVLGQFTLEKAYD